MSTFIEKGGVTKVTSSGIGGWEAEFPKKERIEFWGWRERICCVTEVCGREGIIVSHMAVNVWIWDDEKPCLKLLSLSDLLFPPLNKGWQFIFTGDFVVVVVDAACFVLSFFALWICVSVSHLIGL